MTQYILSDHASDALVKRKIAGHWLEQALDHPDWVEDDPYESLFEHRLAAIEEFGDRVLRVVINPHEVPVFVVTLFFDRRRKRKTNET